MGPTENLQQDRLATGIWSGQDLVWCVVVARSSVVGCSYVRAKRGTRDAVRCFAPRGESCFFTEQNFEFLSSDFYLVKIQVFYLVETQTCLSIFR